MRVVRPPDPDDQWLLAHRWVWSRSGIEHSIAGNGAASAVFVCGIARKQAEMLDLDETVFLLVFDEETQMPGRGAIPRDATAPPELIADSLLAHPDPGN